MHKFGSRPPCLHACCSICQVERKLEAALFIDLSRSLFSVRALLSLLSVCPSVRLSVTRWHCVNIPYATIMWSSLVDSPRTLVS